VGGERDRAPARLGPATAGSAHGQAVVVTSTGAVPDLQVVADRLSRAADKAEEMAAEAPAGPWTVTDANEGSEYPPLWMVTNDAFHKADVDEPWIAVEIHTGSRTLADHIAAFDQRAVTALAPVLHMADGAAQSAIEAGGPLADWVIALAGFAALLLGEEETSG
jgi:hypothetical protein